MKKLLSILMVGFLFFVASCSNKSYDKLTPEQQQEEYIQFQEDSVKLCTQDERLVKAAIESAFDRMPENNSYWKKDNVTVNYDDSLKCWVGVVDYHYDRNNTYYKASETFYAKYWYKNNGLAKDAELFYTVSNEQPVVNNTDTCTCDTVCVDTCVVCDSTK